MIATPLTFDGVTFDVAGRTRDGRVRVTADPNGLTSAATHLAYRRVLDRFHDPGRHYKLIIRTSTGVPR